MHLLDEYHLEVTTPTDIITHDFGMILFQCLPSFIILEPNLMLLIFTLPNHSPRIKSSKYIRMPILFPQPIPNFLILNQYFHAYQSYWTHFAGNTICIYLHLFIQINTLLIIGVHAACGRDWHDDVRLPVAKTDQDCTKLKRVPTWLDDNLATSTGLNNISEMHTA